MIMWGMLFITHLKCSQSIYQKNTKIRNTIFVYIFPPKKLGIEKNQTLNVTLKK